MMTAATLRSTIIRCAAEATQAEPRSVEFRLHSFIAKLSGSFEGKGEVELDAAVWALLESKPRVRAAATTVKLDQWRKRKLFAISADAPGPLAKFTQAAWRSTTPVDDDSLQIGVAFASEDGEVLRLRLPISGAASFCESALEYLNAHRTRVHSRQSPGIPSDDVSTPEDGRKV